MEKHRPNPKETAAKPGQMKKPAQHPSAEKKEPQKPAKPAGSKH